MTRHRTPAGGYYPRFGYPIHDVACLLPPSPTHLAHYWWATSSGGGHMLDRLGDTDPTTADWSRERDVTRNRCPGRRPGLSALLRLEDDGDVWWLVGKRAPELGGTWCTFGGSVDPGEPDVTTILREFLEETGVGLGSFRPTFGTDWWWSGDVGTADRPHRTAVIDARHDAIGAARLGWETDDIAWVNSAWLDQTTAAQTSVTRPVLHRGLAALWATIPDTLKDPHDRHPAHRHRAAPRPVLRRHRPRRLRRQR